MFEKNYEKNHKKFESKGFLIFWEQILNHRVRKIIKKIQINYLKTIQKIREQGEIKKYKNSSKHRVRKIAK